MTDTGRFPGEGQPENAGATPGHPDSGDAATPARTGLPSTYSFLDNGDPTEDDDLLLMPGAQGAWTEQPQAGTHETSGRDGAEAGPDEARTQPTAPAAPRRPLHMGPPVPDNSGGVVRSLADRGPATSPQPVGSPVPQPTAHAPAAEYLEAPQPETEPVAPAPAAEPPGQPGIWDAQPQQPAPAEAPVPVPAARTETPAPAPAEPAEAFVPAQTTGDPATEHPTAPAPAAVDGPQDPAPVPAQSGPAEPSAAPAASGPESAPPPAAPEEPVQAAAPQAGPAAAAPSPAAPAAPVQEPAVAAEPAPEPAVAPAAETPSPEPAVAQPVVAEPAVAEPAVTEPAVAAAGVPAGAEQSAAPQPQPVMDAGVDATVPAAAPAPAAAEVPGDAAGGAAQEVPMAPVEPAAAPQQAAPATIAEPAGQLQLAVSAEETGEPAPAVADPVAPVAPSAPEAVAVQEQPAAAPAADEAAAAEPVAAQAPETVSAEPAPPVPEAPAQPATAPAVSPEPVIPAPSGVVEQQADTTTSEPAAAPEATVVAEPVTEPVAPAEPVATAEPAMPVEPIEPPMPVEPVTSVEPAEPVAAAEPAPAEEQSPAAEQAPQTPVAPEPAAVAAQPEPAEAPAPQPAAQPEPEAAPAATAPAAGTGEPEAQDEPWQPAVPEAEQPAPMPAEPPAPAYDEAERAAVHRVIRERRDIRNGFRTDPIPHDVLLRVLEAAHTAPSVGHSQPWDFVVIRSAETRKAVHELAARQRQAYAQSLPKARAKQFKELKIEAILDTPVNIVVTADPTRGGRHTLGRYTQPQMAPYSSALAVENLWLAARAEGLGVGWVSFFDERELVRELGLPDHLEIVAYLCVGYVDEFPDEPELLQAGWSKRRPLSWVVHEETYGRRALPGEDPHDLLAETLRGIRPLDAKALGEAWERQKRMTKPSGALGMLEIISAQLCGLSRKCPPPIPEPAAVAIFAGDHGVHAQGVTAWPQEVTSQMVANFLGGGAVCNAFANQVGAEVCIVDVGVAAELPATTGLLPRKVRPGTADFTTGPAMTREEALRAVEVGIETARDLITAGNKALLTGEMGIANTTVSAALISVYTGADPAEVTGRGTGINDEMHARKIDAVRRALELHQPDPKDPIGVLAAVGGLEHAALVGLILGGASLRTPVILDGVSAGAAALVARAIAPEALAACIAGHRSAEPGHVAALTKLGLRPLVDLDLRLGEGTGALLALPVVQSAARAMHEVATFDTAGVTEKS
ncbi:nicotinate-nucleotide--dimethylbenzimidazole phosphoribosyltransferase [Streptomyces orinoci]|uniref:Nicotinate-nucleotide--dimethylbenzimidazole phosphoribosyltransferase n=1 Tax=Streptomyces orinoci TaxID=67339 RepID=A0ABV3JW94_STRON|nr:nicotinate-nucleotide--dimethylbenzimidazole phosphoribosyltransferase [Streptomyces orinoci]